MAGVTGPHSTALVQTCMQSDLCLYYQEKNLFVIKRKRWGKLSYWVVMASDTYQHATYCSSVNIPRFAKLKKFRFLVILADVRNCLTMSQLPAIHAVFDFHIK